MTGFILKKIGGDILLKNIKALCKERHISLREVERRSGLAPRTIYRWDESKPSVDKAKAVADYLGVTVDDLLRTGQNSE